MLANFPEKLSHEQSFLNNNAPLLKVAGESLFQFTVHVP